MSIRFDPDRRCFVIHTAHTTYAFDILADNTLRHLYYGKRIREIPAPDLAGASFAPYPPKHGWLYSPDTVPAEFSFFGSGDFRSTALRLTGADGTGVTAFTYKTYRIRKGRRSLDGLTAARPDPDTRTLEIDMTDEVTGVRITLCYTVFPKKDIITRYLILENRGAAPVTVDKCMSLELALDRSDLDMISHWGRHPMEMNRQRVPLHHGTQSVESRRGATSHQYNPLTVLCDRHTAERRGEAYGFNFVYSGSFLCEVDVDQLSRTKVLLGLGSECFTYRLAPGERFTSPEAVMTYSHTGLGRLGRNFHDFVRENILPPSSLLPHPVVLNTWEACYFDINEEKLIAFAEESAKLGFDMLVMDDGWFGARNHDRAALGDWFPNKDKFPRGLGAFARDIRAKGVKFGIWVEPEMVNPDSDLYRAHPEWALCVPGREPLESRQQLVLDMSNEAVIDYLKETFDKTFADVPIDYFKWDMNRHLAQIGSSALPPERQGEVAFAHIKGAYKLLSWFAERFPDAVIETCSGGGGRYDLGMMAHGIQIWTSDNTDPYARTYIQAAALQGYPAATMSCHVSDPHGDLRSLDYRFKVAVGGMLGYELNILHMSDEIKAAIAEQIRTYHTFEHLIRLGDYYPLTSPTEYPYSAYYYTDRRGDEILLTLIETAACKPGKTKRLAIPEAHAAATYTDTLSSKTYSGDDLRRGLTLPLTGERDTAILMHLVKNAD